MTGARWQEPFPDATPIEVRGRAVAAAWVFGTAQLRCAPDEDPAERRELGVDRRRAGAVGCNRGRLHILPALDPDIPAAAAAPRWR